MGTDNHILMVDDDESLLGVMSMRLRQAGFIVDTATQPKAGYVLATKKPYDIIILDVTMPGINGYDICKTLRGQGILTPILMLSGKTEKATVIHCLELGADDYLTKPFNHKELVARIEALIRRNKKTFSARYVKKAGLVLDTLQNTVKSAEGTIPLTRKETLLLQCLMHEFPEQAKREQLLKDVWEINDKHTSNRLDVYIRRLRAKLETINAGEMLQTVRGSGYKLGNKRHTTADASVKLL